MSVAENIEVPAKENSLKRIAWLVLTPMLGVLGYSSLYLIGRIYHEVYLEHFHISATLFEKSPTDHLTHAYAALSQLGMQWFDIILNYRIWLSISVLTLFFLAEFILIERAPEFFKSKRLGERFFHNKWIRLSSFSALLALCVSILILLSPLALNLVLLTPAYIGVEGAKISIEHDQASYSNDCNSAKDDYCVRLLDSTQEIARGYVIDASETHIALFHNGKSTVLPLREYRLETIVPEHEASDSAAIKK